MGDGIGRTAFQLLRIPLDKGLNNTDYEAHLQDGQFAVLQNFVPYNSGTSDMELETRSGTVELVPFGHRVTSLFAYTDSSAGHHLIAVSNGKVYDIQSGSKSNITGTHSFNSGVFWQWIDFEGTAVATTREYLEDAGVPNQYNTLCTWTGTGNVITILPAVTVSAGNYSSRQSLKFCTNWNRRMFCSMNYDNSNLKLIYSPLGSLGTPDTVGGITFYGGWSDLQIPNSIGEPITGLGVLNDYLIIFFRHSVAYIDPGDPNTDATKWNVRKIDSGGIGCLSGYSIAAYKNSLFFLSENGVYRMTADGQTDRSPFNFTHVSSQIWYLNHLANNDEYPAIVGRFTSGNAFTYLISVCSADGSPTNTINNHAYMYDIESDRWFEQTGPYVGTAFAMARDVGGWAGHADTVNGAYFSTLMLGGYDGVHRGGSLGTGVTTDKRGGSNQANITYKFRTKAYDAGNPFIKKLFNYLRLRLYAIDSITITLRYYLDEKLTAPVEEAINFTYAGTSGSVWGTPTWGNFTWSGSATGIFDIERKMENATIGRKGNTVQIEVEASSATAGYFAVSALGVDAFPLSHRDVAMY